jgi:hypothetical protein
MVRLGRESNPASAKVLVTRSNRGLADPSITESQRMPVVQMGYPTLLIQRGRNMALAAQHRILREAIA